MLPVAGKPLLEHIIRFLVSAGLKRIILVVSYMKEKIQNFFGDGRRFNAKIMYAFQEKPLGTAHALLTAAEYVDSDKFLLIYGDVLTKNDNIINLLRFYEKSCADAVISTYYVQDISKYGLLEIKNGNVTNIIEKPENKSSGYINAGIYVFNSAILDTIEKVKLSVRGEYELTDAIREMITRGYTVKAYELKDWWIDVGYPWDLLRANELLMRDLQTDIRGIVEEYAVIKGPVVVGRDAVIRAGAYIEGPVIIGEESDIGPNCYIRPYTYIGRRCRIGNACEVKNSIIMDGTHIAHLSYVGDSIIGENVNFGAGTIVANLRFDDKPVKVTIKGEKISSGRRKLGAIIGDNVKTGIGCTIMPGVTVGPNSILGPNALILHDVPPNTVVKDKW